MEIQRYKTEYRQRAHIYNDNLLLSYNFNIQNNIKDVLPKTRKGNWVNAQILSTIFNKYLFNSLWGVY